MARKKDPPKPIYPLVHEFQDSVHDVLLKAGMLMTACETLLDMGRVDIGSMPALRERVDALKQAMYGDE